MSIWSFFEDRWKKEATHFTYVPFDNSRVDGGNFSPGNIVARNSYFRLTLAEMYLCRDRQWFSDWSPAAYCLIRFNFGDTQQTFSHVAGPSTINEIEQSGGAYIARNFTMVPVVPYNGGDVEIEAGLVAMKGSDDARQLLKVLTDISATLTIPQLSAAVAFAQPILNGIEALVGADKNMTVLRLHDTLNEGTGLRARYLAAIGAPAGTIPERELFIRNDGLCRGVNLDSALPLNSFNYLLFRIDSIAQRSDWEDLTALKEPFDKAISLLRQAATSVEPEKQISEARRQLVVAKMAALDSKDLTRDTGPLQVSLAMQRKFDMALKLLTGDGGAAAVRDFSFASAMEEAISMEQAAHLPPLRREDLLEQL